MKILKLLNKKYFLIIFIFLFSPSSFAEDRPIDIWNIDKKKLEDSLEDKTSSETSNTQIKESNESSIYKMQTQKEANEIQLDSILDSKGVRIIGLYDPEDYGLDINMWSYSDGDQLKNIFSKILKIDLSKDAAEIMNILMLTNAHSPQKNISEQQFLKFKSDWLIKNADLDLIEEYLIKNQIFDVHPKLSKFLIDYYLSKAEINKSCEILSKN